MRRMMKEMSMCISNESITWRAHANMPQESYQMPSLLSALSEPTYSITGAALAVLLSTKYIVSHQKQFSAESMVSVVSLVVMMFMAAIHFGGTQAALDEKASSFGPSKVKIRRVVPPAAVNRLAQIAGDVRAGQEQDMMPVVPRGTPISAAAPQSTANARTVTSAINTAVTNQNQRSGLHNGAGHIPHRHDPVDDKPGGAWMPGEEPTRMQQSLGARAVSDERTKLPTASVQERYLASDGPQRGDAASTGLSVTVPMPASNNNISELDGVFAFTGLAPAGNSAGWTQSQVDLQHPSGRRL